MNVKSKGRKVGWLLLGILLAAFLGRVVFWVAMDPSSYHQRSDAFFYQRTAESIAKELSYAENGIPTAQKPPLYPLFAGLLLHLLGNQTGVIVAQYLFGVLSGIPIFLLARTFLKDQKALLLTAVYAFYPKSWHWESGFMSEPLALWIINLFFLHIYGYWRKGRITNLWLASLWAGLALLTRTASAVSLVLVLAYATCQGRVTRKLASSLSCIGIVALVLSPWVIRNFLTLDSFVPTTTQVGLTLYSSYVSWGYDMSIVNILPEDQTILDQLEGEVEKDAYLLKRTISYLAEQPLQVFALIPMKIKDYLHPFHGRWYPLNMGSKYDLPYGILTSFAFLGILWTRKAGNTLANAAFLFVLGGIASAIVSHGEIRYGYLMTTPLFLLAGFCFAEQIQERQKGYLLLIVALNVVLWVAGIAFK
ncbi:MAG: glycosyltransferase family 39 protein [Desulfobacterota bacterium]|nr:glycosyltransferase family 39 protein [Thermodesulfobacteriota bacterium]